MSVIQAGDRVYITQRSSQWFAHVGEVVKTAPGSVQNRIWVSFDGWKQVVFYTNDLRKVVQS